jgi:hypothetical protein
MLQNESQDIEQATTHLQYVPMLTIFSRSPLDQSHRSDQPDSKTRRYDRQLRCVHDLLSLI